MIGTHITYRDSLLSTLSHHREKLINCCVFQSYIANKNSYSKTNITDEDIKASCEYCKENKISFYVHENLIYNLAGKAKDNLPAWKDDKLQFTQLANIMKNINRDLQVTCKTNGGCVVHPGSLKDRKMGHDMVAQTLNNIEYPNDSFLLLENCAGEGTKLAKTLEEIKYVIDKVTPNKRDHIGVCLDTAHMFGSGMCSFEDEKSIVKLFEEIKSTVGIDKIKLFHLNDS